MRSLGSAKKRDSTTASADRVDPRTAGSTIRRTSSGTSNRLRPRNGRSGWPARAISSSSSEATLRRLRRADPIVLEFDHLGDKLFGIGQVLERRTWNSILE